MKKVLSIVLSLAMVVCMMPLTAFAASANDAAYSDITGEKCEGAVNVLSALGVVNGYEDGTYKPANIVTRAEMAKLIITALGMESYATATTSSYTDMTNAKWAIPVVEYATNLGIINGYGNGKFGPNDTVTYEQAATMIVRALGFTTDCNEMNGTYPAIYIQKATALGVFKDVDGNQYGTGANRGDIAIMLYNVLETPEVYADKDGETHDKTGANGAKITMMTTLNKSGSSTYGVLTPELADEAVNKVSDLVGAAGKIVKDKNGKVLSVGDIQTTFLTGDYNASTKKFEADDIEYTIANDAYSTIGANATTTTGVANVATFKNNASGTASTLADLGKGTYTLAVKVSGKTIKNIYSIAEWDADTAKKVTASDIRKITSDKSLLGYKFPKDDDGAIDTAAFILNGVDSLDKIAADNIVAVYKNNDNIITKVEVGTKVVSGKVSKIKSNSDPSKVVYTVDGTEYKASKLPNNSVDLEVGDEAEMYLDYDGKIYTTDAVESGYLYGIVLKGVGTNSSYDDTDNLIKVLQSNGTASVLAIKNSATANVIKSELGEIDPVTKVDPAKGILVRYKINSDNKVSEMTKATSTTGDTKYSNGVIDGKICADDMVVFVAKNGLSDDEDDYKVVSASGITDDIDAGAFYFANSKNDIKAILVDESATDATDIFGLINSSSRTQNAKDDNVYEITGVAEGAAFDALTKDITGSYITDSFTLVKVKKSGDEISEISKAALKAATAVLSESNFEGMSEDAVMYADGATDNTLGTDLKEYKVTKVSGDRVQIDGTYQTVKGAKVYVPTLDSDNNFDAWTIGSIDDISIDGYVVLLQTSKKSSNWDTVIYIPDTVADDCPSLIGK